jgi:hypothetical protein
VKYRRAVSVVEGIARRSLRGEQYRARLGERK